MTEASPMVALASDDPEERRRAVIAIGETPGPDGSQALLLALADTEWRVRKEAVRVAREQAVSRALLPDLLAAICQGDNVGFRNAALDVLEALGAAAADVLIAALPTVSADTKKFVIEALACGGDPRVAATLVETSRGGDVMTAVTAIEALSVIGGPVAERALRGHLKSDESLLRLAALDGLNRLGAILSWEQLEPLLSNRLSRRVATAALGRCGRREAIAPLLSALTERSLHLVRTAVTSLAQLQLAGADVLAEVDHELRQLPEDARERLRDLTVEVDGTVREAAVQLLVAARDEPGLGEVIEMAATDMLPSTAHEGLRSWGRPLARLLLQRSEADNDRLHASVLELASDAAWECLAGTESTDVALRSEVRHALRIAIARGGTAATLAAVRCLGVWAEADDAALLVEVAARDGGDVAYACARSLTRLAERESTAVQHALDTVSFDGPAAAPLVSLLATLAGPNSVVRLQAALSAQDPATRKAAIQALASLSDPKVSELIAFALADESVDVQMTAARAIGGLRDLEGNSVALDALLLALGSASDGVRASAARSLGSSGDRRSISPLRELVAHGSPGVMVAAIEALRALHDPDVGQLLTGALTHEDEEVVKQALYAIADARAPHFVDAIAGGLSHAAWDVRRLSAELLGGFGDASVVPALRAQQEREVDDLAREAISLALRNLGAA